MSRNKKISYNDLLKIEEQINFADRLQTILDDIYKVNENKSTSVIGYTPDKKVYFYTDGSVLNCAEFEINEDKVSIKNISQIDVEKENFDKKFKTLVSEAIDKFAEKDYDTADGSINEAIDCLKRKLNLKPLKAFKLYERVEAKKAYNKEELNKAVEVLEQVTNNFVGEEKEIKETIIESSNGITEEKEIVVDTICTNPLRNWDKIRKSAFSLDIKPIFENVTKFLHENEELYLLTTDEFKARLKEASKDNIKVTSNNIDKISLVFNKQRIASKDLAKLFEGYSNSGIALTGILGAQQNLKEQDEETPASEIAKDVDADINQIDKEETDDKMSFMKIFVTIIRKILDKVGQLTDDNTVKQRVASSLEKIGMVENGPEGEERKWDKDELIEIAKEAIELAAALEGISPDEETEVDKEDAADDAEQDDKQDKEEVKADLEAAKAAGKPEDIKEGCGMKYEDEEEASIAPEEPGSTGDEELLLGEKEECCLSLDDLITIKTNLDDKLEKDENGNNELLDKLAELIATKEEEEDEVEDDEAEGSEVEDDESTSYEVKDAPVKTEVAPNNIQQDINEDPTNNIQQQMNEDWGRHADGINEALTLMKNPRLSDPKLMVKDPVDKNDIKLEIADDEFSGKVQKGSQQNAEVSEKPLAEQEPAGVEDPESVADEVSDEVNEPAGKDVDNIDADVPVEVGHDEEAEEAPLSDGDLTTAEEVIDAIIEDIEADAEMEEHLEELLGELISAAGYNFENKDGALDYIVQKIKDGLVAAKEEASTEEVPVDDAGEEVSDTGEVEDTTQETPGVDDEDEELYSDEILEAEKQKEIVEEELENKPSPRDEVALKGATDVIKEKIAKTKSKQTKKKAKKTIKESKKTKKAKK